MNDLGVRIKQLRKEKKMTLQQLAGTRLTKGMLSLIENGKAQPSMESLQFIAEQLQVDVTTLLNNDFSSELKQLLNEVETLFSSFSPFSENDDIKLQIIEKIRPVYDKLRQDSYEQIRLKDIYLQFMIKDGEIEKEEMLLLIDAYEAVHAYSYMLKVARFLASYEFHKYKYEEALSYLQLGYERVQAYWLLIDDLAKLDLFYNFTVTYSAINDKDQAEFYMNTALKIAKERNIFYRMDDFYRLMYTQAIMQLDSVESAYYLKKLKQLYEFSENVEMYDFLAFGELHFETRINQNYHLVESMVEQIELEVEKLGGKLVEKPDQKLSGGSLFTYERGYAQFKLLQFERALLYLKEVTIPFYVHHPIDFVIFYQYMAVRAACLYEVGQVDEATKEILYVMKKIENYPQSLYTDIINEMYERIINE